MPTSNDEIRILTPSGMLGYGFPVDHFKLGLVIGREQRTQSVCDHFAFIVGRNDYARGLGKICPRLSPKSIGQPNHNERASHNEHGRDNHECPEKFFDAVIDVEAGAAHETHERLPALLQGWHDPVPGGAQQCA